MVSPSKKSGYKEDKNCDRSKHSYKPLENTKFFFYSFTNVNKITDTIKEELRHLGGVIDEFFSKDVNYVVTPKKTVKTDSKGSSSDNSIHKSISSCVSPIYLYSPREEKRRPRTRTEALLEKARTNRQGSTDVLENARNLKIPVIYLAKLLNWLDKLRSSPSYQPIKKSRSNSLRSSNDFLLDTKTQRFKNTFVKFESYNRTYRPNHKELKAWPTVTLDSKTNSPFAEKSKENCLHSSVHKGESHRNKSDFSKGSEARKQQGYCELCYCSFSNLSHHLNSASHVAFVENSKNYEQLDQIIAGFGELNSLEFNDSVQCGIVPV